MHWIAWPRNVICSSKFEAWFYRALVLLEWIEHSTSPLPRGQGRTGKLLGIKRFFLMTDSPDFPPSSDGNRSIVLRNSSTFRWRSHSLLLCNMLKHKKADRGRQIALLAHSVNSTDQFRQGHVFEMSDFFELSPKSLFKADAGFMSIQHDGTFNHG